MLNLGCFGKERKKTRKRGTGSAGVQNGLLPILSPLLRQGLPCHDRACRPGRTQQACAHGWNTRAAGTRARQRLSVPCHDRVWGWDRVTWVVNEVFSIAIESFWFYVVIMDGVTTGCGQGWKALCHDTEIVSRQGGAMGAHQCAWQMSSVATDFLKFSVTTEIVRPLVATEILCRDKAWGGGG